MLALTVNTQATEIQMCMNSSAWLISFLWYCVVQSGAWFYDYIRELLLREHQSVVVTRRIRWERSSVTAPVLMWRFLLSPKSRGFSGTPLEQEHQEEAVGDDEVTWWTSINAYDWATERKAGADGELPTLTDRSVWEGRLRRRLQTRRKDDNRNIRRYTTAGMRRLVSLAVRVCRDNLPLPIQTSD